MYAGLHRYSRTTPVSADCTSPAPGAVVALHRTVGVAEVHGPAQALQLVDALDVYPRSELRGACGRGVNNLMVIIQTIHRRSIQLVELKKRPQKTLVQKKRERGSRVPQPSGFEVQ